MFAEVGIVLCRSWCVRVRVYLDEIATCIDKLKTTGYNGIRKLRAGERRGTVLHDIEGKHFYCSFAFRQIRQMISKQNEQIYDRAYSGSPCWRVRWRSRIFHYKSMPGRFTLIIRNGCYESVTLFHIPDKQKAERSDSKKVENKRARTHIVKARSQGASKPAKRMRTGKLLAWHAPSSRTIPFALNSPLKMRNSLVNCNLSECNRNISYIQLQCPAHLSRCVCVFLLPPLPRLLSCPAYGANGNLCWNSINCVLFL